MVFVVGNTDYSASVISGTYKVNEKDIYDSFIDANGIEHRNIYRTQVAGSFSMLFRTLKEYHSFLEVLKQNKTVEGYYPCKLAVNNTGKIVTRNVYILFEPTRFVDALGRDSFDKISVQVEEI